MACKSTSSGDGSERMSSDLRGSGQNQEVAKDSSISCEFRVSPTLSQTELSRTMTALRMRTREPCRKRSGIAVGW
jgi:hypothetical protein